MPNLHTLVSRPMDGQRRLGHPSSGLSITVSNLRNLVQRLTADLRENIGFTDYFIPLLESLASQAANAEAPTNKITHLFYSAEGLNAHSPFFRMEASLECNILENLVHLDLCLCSEDGDSQAFEGFTVCLANARSLGSLKICMEKDPFMSTFGVIPTLPKLVNCRFHSAPREDTEKVVFHLRDSWSFISYRSLTLGFVALGYVRYLVRRRHRQRRDDYGEDCDDDYYSDSDSVLSGVKRHERMNEQIVLAYVNRAEDPDRKIPLPSYIGQKTQISTHSLVFDTTTCQLSAFHATRDNLWQKRGYNLKDIEALDSATFERRDEHGIAHSLGPRRIYHIETGLWVDSDEVFYDPVTDEEVDEPFENREMPKDDSWTVQGQHTWDSEMGLWRDGRGKLKKFAAERELPERPNVPAEGQDSDFHIDMQPFYDRKEDEYLLRIENSPWWDWGRDANGQVWYWEVNGTAGHATETWRFEHNGEFAYGHEPLDFWDDWYDEPGDKAESTPYGWNLYTFLASNRLGSEIPQRSTCKPLRLYCKKDDPMYGNNDLFRHLPKPMDYEVWSDEPWP
ncbi:uncharacterized protein FFMR_05405 [Fusarium fujikuroi]|nr:uncharacterized protein FFMR_05405 [Fusarium fujikuroi]